MKMLTLISTSLVLVGCTSHPKQSSASFQKWNQEAWKKSLNEMRRQREAADAQAKASGDNRPYPKGWPVGMLPRNGDPRVVESIHPGQTMEDVATIIGTEGWPLNETRDKFLSSLRSSYRMSHSSMKEPNDWNDLKMSLPAQGHFTEWRFQGFPSTADWIVIFFASTQGQQDGGQSVVARGVFRLGDFF